MSLETHFLVGGLLLALFAFIWWGAPLLGREACSKSMVCFDQECLLRCKHFQTPECFGPPPGRQRAPARRVFLHEPAGGRRSASSVLTAVERTA